MEDYDINIIHKRIRTQTPQTNVYYGILLGTHCSRINIVSVPVDIGIDHARTPQDMAVEFWLSHAMYGTQKVINLATNFENLPNVPLNDVDEAIHYTLVMESQTPTQHPGRCDSNHLLKNMLPTVSFTWLGDLLVLKWSTIEGMMNIHHSDIPMIRQKLEIFFHKFSHGKMDDVRPTQICSYIRL
ncbi:hypothetical protein BYT27DRAFT_7194913 [Phlegmacium glaucopus]|nr:hypothetical protein BYT27DRAFT_7194913 [Phlegmacium glaucopus]